MGLGGWTSAESRDWTSAELGGWAYTGIGGWLECEEVAASDTSGTGTKAASGAATASGLRSPAKEVSGMSPGESTEGTGTVLGETTEEAGLISGATKEGGGLISDAMKVTAVVGPDAVRGGTGAGFFTGIGRGRGLDTVGSSGGETVSF